MKKNVQMFINNDSHQWEIEAGERLLDSLRKYGFTEVKEGCGSGECGACSVIVDDSAICSCLTFTEQVQKKSITTSLGVTEKVPELEQAFLGYHAVQCGFCTPGMLVSAAPLMDKAALTIEKVHDQLEGNLCRCTGYVRIEQAIQAAYKKVSARSGK